jgi:hypothetical protein
MVVFPLPGIVRGGRFGRIPYDHRKIDSTPQRLPPIEKLAGSATGVSCGGALLRSLEKGGFTERLYRLRTQKRNGGNH